MATSAAPNERDSYPLQTTSQAADPAEVQEGSQICPATSRSQQSTRVQAYDMETTQPSHPHQWSTRKRLRISIIVCFATITASFTSAIYAAGVTRVCEKLEIKSVVADLGTTLYVLGFAFGPIIWAPVSEVIGRYWPLNVGMLGCSIFTIGSAVAHNMQTLLVTRFFAGFCAASPLSIAPAVYADIYQTLQRSVAIAIYAMAMFMAPLIAPIVGTFVANGLGWRWTLYIPAIMGFCSSLLLAAFMPETYAPIILRKRETQGHGTALKDWAQKYLTRPLRLLVAEPIVLLMSLYVSFIYALLYAFLVAYPFVFETIHHMSSSVATLPLLSLIWGELVGGLLILSQQGAYARRLAANEGIVIPEWRLPQAVIGSVAFAVGLFWFAWTSYTSSVHWMAPTSAGVLIGYGMYCIFIQCFNYLIDSYPSVTASVVAANTMLRSGLGACFPLFSRQMFSNMQIQWAGTLLAGLALLMIPIPIAFQVYGPSLRARSRFVHPASVSSRNNV